MISDSVMRPLLWISALFNFMAATMLAFPDQLGALGGLPQDAPRLYPSMMCLVVGAFGVAYAWLARAPVIDRPLIALAAFIKAGLFFLTLGFHLGGEAPLRAVILTSGDLAFAVLFTLWLLRRGPATVATAR